MNDLLGRDGDLAFIHAFLGNSEVQGAALLLSGEAGVSKTAVPDAVATGATYNGVRVLRAAGMQFEVDISYAGLNQLLVPLFDDFDILDPVHRDALRIAVGIGGGPVPDRLLTTPVLLLLRLTAGPYAAAARRRRPAVAGPGDQRRARVRGPATG